MKRIEPFIQPAELRVNQGQDTAGVYTPLLLQGDEGDHVLDHVLHVAGRVAGPEAGQLPAGPAEQADYPPQVPVQGLLLLYTVHRQLAGQLPVSVPT